MPDYALDLILAIVLPIATAAGSLVAAYLTHWLRENIAHTQTQDLMVRAVAAAELSVAEVAQSYVDALKANSADGRLTTGEAEDALEDALDRAYELLGPKGIARARQVLGEDDEAIERWIVALIESKVRELKQ